MLRTPHLLLTAVCGALMMPAAVWAQAPKSDQARLLERLNTELQCQPGQKCDAQMRTRGLGGPAERPANAKTDSGRRSLELDARSRALPTSDVEVLFDLNSAELQPEARKTLDTMAQALKGEKLAASNFAVVGHTDARGADAFNQELSERRAKAVLDYLAGNGGVENQRLTSWGRGKTELKNPNDPLSGANRRVQLINTGASQGVPPSTTPEPQTSSAVQPPAPPPAAARPQQPAQATPPPAQTPASTEECRQFSPLANATVECQR